jgi:hypothetical protein
MESCIYQFLKGWREKSRTDLIRTILCQGSIGLRRKERPTVFYCKKQPEKNSVLNAAVYRNVGGRFRKPNAMQRSQNAGCIEQDGLGRS